MCMPPRASTRSTFLRNEIEVPDDHARKEGKEIHSENETHMACIFYEVFSLCDGFHGKI